jgi:hypothetical protein
MPTVLYPPSRPQSIGEVLDSAFRIFRVTLLRCLPYGVLTMVASQLQGIYEIGLGRAPHQFGRNDPVWWAVYVLGALLAFTLINAILIQQLTMASGSRPAARAVLLDGLKKTPASFAVFLLAGVITALCFAPLLAIPRSFWSGALPLLSLPAAYVGVLLSCSWAAMVIGQKGILGSLRYSAHLIRGNWWRTVAVYLVAWAMLGVLFVSAWVFAEVFATFTAGGDLAIATAISTVVVTALSAIYVPLFTATALSLYGDLEARKEGADLQRRMADVAAS